MFRNFQYLRQPARMTCCDILFVLLSPPTSRNSNSIQSRMRLRHVSRKLSDRKDGATDKSGKCQGDVSIMEKYRYFETWATLRYCFGISSNLQEIRSGSFSRFLQSACSCFPHCLAPLSNLYGNSPIPGPTISTEPHLSFFRFGEKQSRNFVANTAPK